MRTIVITGGPGRAVWSNSPAWMPGGLWEIEDRTMLRYWCHVGHAFTADAVLSAQGEEIEKLRGRLHRPHQERAGRTRRMADQKRVRNMDKLASHPETRAREYEDDASLMRGALRSGVASSAVARLSSKWT